jgi:hypothetical protein
LIWPSPFAARNAAVVSLILVLASGDIALTRTPAAASSFDQV